jgi:hypothetical protein
MGNRCAEFFLHTPYPDTTAPIPASIMAAVALVVAVVEAYETSVVSVTPANIAPNLVFTKSGVLAD